MKKLVNICDLLPNGNQNLFTGKRKYKYIAIIQKYFNLITPTLQK